MMLLLVSCGAKGGISYDFLTICGAGHLIVIGFATQVWTPLELQKPFDTKGCHAMGGVQKKMVANVVCMGACGTVTIMPFPSSRPGPHSGSG